jgi:hypothetical protein
MYGWVGHFSLRISSVATNAHASLSLLCSGAWHWQQASTAAIESAWKCLTPLHAWHIYLSENFAPPLQTNCPPFRSSVCCRLQNYARHLCRAKKKMLPCSRPQVKKLELVRGDGGDGLCFHGKAILPIPRKLELTSNFPGTREYVFTE